MWNELCKGIRSIQVFAFWGQELITSDEDSRRRMDTRSNSNNHLQSAELSVCRSRCQRYANILLTLAPIRVFIDFAVPATAAPTMTHTPATILTCLFPNLSVIRPTSKMLMALHMVQMIENRLALGLGPIQSSLAEVKVTTR